MKINFVTQNEDKVREFKSILEPKIEVIPLRYDYPELRSNDPEEIARLAAKQLAETLKKAVVVEDSGFFIKALNGFPGTCSAYVHQRLGNKAYIKLMKGVKGRTCFYKSAIGFCRPGKSPISFLGVEEGRVAGKPRGKKGWGHDPIFIPKGSNKTYGECKPATNLFRKRALQKFKVYIKNKV